MVHGLWQSLKRHVSQGADKRGKWTDHGRIGLEHMKVLKVWSEPGKREKSMKGKGGGVVVNTKNNFHLFHYLDSSQI